MNDRDRAGPGRIIVLNGPTSSGKSSISGELATLLDPPPLISNIDAFLHMLPPIGHIGMEWRQRTNTNARRDRAPVWWVIPDDPLQGVRIELSEAGQRMVRGMHRAVAALAHAGNDIIFEYVQLYAGWLGDFQTALAGLNTTMVGVHAPLDIIEKRERERGDRVVGQARGHYDAVHDGVTYDVTVDTSQLNARQAAERIATFLRRN